MAELQNTDLKKIEFISLNSLIDELMVQKEILLEAKDLEIITMANLKILSITRKFAKIDESILKLVNSTDISGTYFTEVLTLETLRLRFKEEISRCENLKQIQA